MTQIIIRDLILHGYHGVYPEESISGTLFKLNIILDLSPLLKGYETDSIHDTVNYEIIVRRLIRLTSQCRYHLIERLCQAICTDLLEIPGIIQADVTVEKYIEGMTEHPQWFGVRRVVKGGVDI